MRRNVEVKQNMFNATGMQVWREDAENMKAKGGSEFEAGQDKNFIQQATIFSQATSFIGQGAIQIFEQGKLLDLSEHGLIARNRVVVSKRDNVQATHFG